jgi:serine/threonine protein kinase
MVGSYQYMPPEMLIGEIYDRTADVWAAGVILYELLAGIDMPKFDGSTKE